MAIFKPSSYASGLGSWMTPLHHTALHNQLEAAKILVANGADHTERGFQVRTILIIVNQSA